MVHMDFGNWKGHIEGICNLKPTTINVTRYIFKNLCGLFYAPSQMVFKFYESGLMYMIIMQFSKVWSWYYLRTNDLQQMKFFFMYMTSNVPIHKKLVNGLFIIIINL